MRAQHEVLRSECIDRRNPSDDAPANIVAKTVVHDIKRREVTTFPIEKLEQVDAHDCDGYQHRVAEVTTWIQLGLFGGEGADDQTPAHHAEATIDELLQIDAKERGMQLDAPIEVPDEVTGKAAILRSGPEAAFQIQTYAEDQGEEHECCQYLAEMIPDDPGLEEVDSKGGAQEKSVGDEPGRDPIESVAGTVAGRCDGPFEDLPGEPLE